MIDMIRRIMSKEEQLHLAAIIKAERHQRLHELGRMIRGTSYAGPETKGASVVENKFTKPGPIEREIKLKELGKMVRG
jgi:hypothetical protein